MVNLTSDAKSQLAALAAGKISSVELLDLAVERWRQTHLALNAVIKTDIENARDHAKVADQQRAEGRLTGPLHGLPMTIKDCLEVESLPASGGYEPWAHRRAPTNDAVAVAKARRAGALIWGKTNVPELAADLQTYNKIFGTTNNPHDLSRTPGGSSGGAAAALAAGVTALEIGSDIGGSLRTPAHFCGVASLKPSWGVVSQLGHLPPAPGTLAEGDLSVVGPMARSVRDVALLFGILADAPTGLPLLGDPPRLAMWIDDPVFLADNATRTAFEALIPMLEKAGSSLNFQARPIVDTEALLNTYLQLLAPIMAQGMPRQAFGMLELARPIMKAMRGLGGGVFSAAGYAAAMTGRHVEWLNAHETRLGYERQAKAFFADFDAILMPVTPTAAQKHNQKGSVPSRKMEFDGGMIPYGNHLSWIAFATTLRLPSAVVRIGETPEGLPIGTQIVGPAGADTKVLAIAAKIESLTGGYREPALKI